jgi:hypothetical protein
MTGIECRIASLRAFIEARDRQLELSFGDDNCGRQEGGKFGPGNSCQEDGDGGRGVSESIRRQVNDAGVASFSGSNVPKIFGKAKTVTIAGADEALKVFDDLARGGLTLDKAISMLPGARENDAEVQISGTQRSDGSGYISATARVPLDIPTNQTASGNVERVRIKTEIERFTDTVPATTVARSEIPFDSPVSSALHLDLFSISHTTQRLIVDGHESMKTPEAERTPEQSAAVELSARIERQISSKMMSMTVAAISAAEEAGVDAVYTYAAGGGSGSTNLGSSPDTYRGYALWGRFGLDGVVVKPGWGGSVDRKLAQIAGQEDHPDRGVLTAESWQKYLAGQNLTLQDLMETKQGERLWRQHGMGAYLALNLKDKNSKGYKRFMKLKKAASRAGNSRAFFWWLAEHRGDPMDYFKVERRNCGTGSGGFQKGNTCGGQAVQDVAVGAAKGAVTGAAAAVGKTGGFPPAVAAGAGAGAAIGAVKGLYDNRMRPTRAGKAIKAIGSSDEQVASMVKGLGGSPKSVAEADGKNAVTLSIKGKDGKSQFDVRMTKSEVRIKPAAGRQNLTAGDIKQIKKIAEENSPKSVGVVVDAVPTSVLSKMVKAGASLAVDAAGALVAAFVVPSVPAIAGTAIEATTGIDVEKTKAVQWMGEKVLGNLPKRRG